MYKLEDKVAVVTGGANGIGLATVKAFLEKGAKVVISDVADDLGKEEVEKLKEKGFKDVAFIHADVSNETDVQNLIKEAVQLFGSLDIMVNNAGISSSGDVTELAYEDYKKVMAINADGVFLGMKYAIERMVEQGTGGSVINLASIEGQIGDPNLIAYNGAKGAVNLFTKSAALAHAKDGIRVSAVGPAYVDSGMVNPENLGQEAYDSLINLHPLGRLGKAEEIAHAICFLVENEFTTGTTLYVDGGYTAQ